MAQVIIWWDSVSDSFTCNVRNCAFAFVATAIAAHPQITYHNCFIISLIFHLAILRPLPSFHPPTILPQPEGKIHSAFLLFFPSLSLLILLFLRCLFPVSLQSIQHLVICLFLGSPSFGNAGPYMHCYTQQRLHHSCCTQIPRATWILRHPRPKTTTHLCFNTCVPDSNLTNLTKKDRFPAISLFMPLNPEPFSYNKYLSIYNINERRCEDLTSACRGVSILVQ